MTGIDRVRAALRQQDVDPSHEELLDILWLARAVALDDGSTVTRWANGAGAGADPLAPADGARAGEAGGAVQDGPDPAVDVREQLHTPAGLPGTSGPGRPVRVPGHHPISNPIQLRRALRPLRRYRRPSWTAQLDETATANLIAETSLLQLVHRPEALRSKDLLLVVDDGTSMRLWQDLAAELQRLLRNLGAFRRVIAIGVDSDRADRAEVHARPFALRPGSLPRQGGGPRHSPAVLVLSDGVGAGWRSGAMQEFLDRHCAHSTVAVLQPLPPTLWSGTALQPTRLTLTAPVGGTPNQRLGSGDPLLPDVISVLPAVPVPLIELSAGQLRGWALLAAAGGTVTLPVIDARAPAPAGPTAGRQAVEQAPAEARLAAFRTAASPQAYQLAAHLSTVQPLTLPVMRVVQEAVLPRSHPGYLAEVFLGGLLHATSAYATSADAVYALHPGVAELLMAAVDTGDALNTVRVVSAFLERPTARTASLSAVLPDPHGTGRIPDGGHALAEVGGPFLRYLGILPPAPAVAATPGSEQGTGAAAGTAAGDRSPLARLREELAVERAIRGPQQPAVAARALRFASALADAGELSEVASLVKQVLADQRLTPGSGARPTAEEQRLLQLLTEWLARRGARWARFGEAIDLAAELNQIPGVRPLDWLIDALCPPSPHPDPGYETTRVRAALSRTGDNLPTLLTALAELAEALNVRAAETAYRSDLAALRADRARLPHTASPEPAEVATWGPDLPRPYFYLSYAHTPGSASSGSDPNQSVYRLFDDLCETIMEMTTTPASQPVGFIDRSVAHGLDPAERVAEAVAHCRVFVPLYSPRYFKSTACGQEWWAFANRPVAQRGISSHHTGIVPVWWARMPAEELPAVASRLQFNHSDFGKDYLSEGMYGLSRLRGFRDAYELAVHRLAQRIILVAESVALEVGPRQDITALPSAFAPPPAPQPQRPAPHGSTDTPGTAPGQS